MTLKLTSAERLILAQQYRILALLDPDEEADWTWRMDVVLGGYEPMYAQLDLSLNLDTPVSQDTATLVTGTLAVFQHLQSEAQGHETELTERQRQVLAFPGFCHNTENDELAYLGMLHRGPRRDYASVIGKEVRSTGGATLPGYRRMIAAYRAIPDRQRLSLDQVREVLDAYPDPSVR